jgi:hypothetical protein
VSYKIIYNKDTGKIVKCRAFTDEHLALNLRMNPHWATIDGQIDPKSLRDFRVNVQTHALEEIVRPFDAGFHIRVERKKLLDASDWTQMPDNNLTTEQRTAWTVYRQQLRDMPDTFAGVNSVDEIVWPVKP